ncbi:hypothetical protein [Heyndrickxia ginsengihumi]|uniref:hypothetical protein n=1 Tax=Heyndrickxia ginsengihumi TaxID=363870 RepID=UPI003D1CB2EF
MIVTINNQTWKFEHPTVDDIIRKINDETNEQTFFSYFIADGQEIYDDHELYLEDNLQNINHLMIVLKTVQELIGDILLSALDYIKRARPQVEALVDVFYQHADEEAWQSFSNFLEGLQWLNQSITITDQNEQKPKNWMQVLAATVSLQEVLLNLADALENKDEVLIADILQYEILPLLQRMQEEFETTIDQEGYLYDVN